MARFGKVSVLPISREARIGRGIADLARDSGNTFIFADAMRRDWERANAQLDAARAWLQDVRDFTDRCNAAYGPDGRVDERMARELEAEYRGRFAAD